MLHAVAYILAPSSGTPQLRLYPVPELGYQARLRRHAPAVFTAETRSGRCRGSSGRGAEKRTRGHFGYDPLHACAGSGRAPIACCDHSGGCASRVHRLDGICAATSATPGATTAAQTHRASAQAAGTVQAGRPATAATTASSATTTAAAGAGRTATAHLFAMDQVLSQGPGGERQGSLFHRQGCAHRVRYARRCRRADRAAGRAKETAPCHATARDVGATGNAR